MTITDELREWARNNTVQDKVLTTYPVQHPVHGTVESLLRIADRIDTEHEHKMEERADRYSELRAKMNNCYIELPKDADSEPVRIGDVMEWPTTGETFEVVGIGDGVLFYIEDGSERADWTGASTKRHHKSPTVEDVLREFAYGLGVPVADSYIAASAAKLRLAGDAE